MGAFTVRTAGAFTVVATGTPVPGLTASGALPPGVTFADNGDGTGTFAGTPTAVGTYAVTVEASNGETPDATRAVTLVVRPGGKFDMKANSIGKQSPGWDRVMPGTRYSAATGYGWATTGSVGGSTGGRVPAGGDARVLGDYAYGLTPVAFKVFVGAGQSATVTVHTYAAPTQGKQGVRASVAGPGGTTQTLRGSGTVTVSGTAGADGVLTVTFSTAPGSSLWIVNALEVTPTVPA
ncbi:hypothetical protein [Gemmata sp.]|uniref:hypothetical protein n=1 Tax=Gemmata sp. TaxID=1914242 RepID=UPI003F71EE64